jgi:hypothetical protein
MELAPQNIELLASRDGLKASHIAKQQEVDRKQIKAVLYKAERSSFSVAQLPVQ